MATRNKLSRKEVMEPDSFLVFTDKALHYYHSHRSLIFGVLGGLVVVALGAGAFNYSRTQSALKMETTLFEMSRSDSDAQPVSLEELKIKFQTLNGNEFRLRGGLILADAYYQEGQFDEAIERYQEVNASSKPNSLFRQLAQAGVAYSLESKQEYDKAIEAFKTLMAQGGDYPLFDIYAGLVRCHEMKKDSASALSVLREMESKFSDHSQFNWVERRIKRHSATA